MPTPPVASDEAPVRYLDEVFTDGQVVETEDLTYAEALDAEGQARSLELDLFEAPSNPDPARPVLVLLSGGGFTGDNKDSQLLVRWARAMARRGYVVATIEYRTDDDDGLFALVRSIERAIEDLRAAVRWLRANQATGGHAADFPLAGPGETVDLRIDPDRISAGGYSAGAVTAASASWREVLFASARDPDAPGFSPIVNPTNDGVPWEISASIAAAGAALGGQDAGDPPLLMFHGDGDTRVAYDGDTGPSYGDYQFSGTQTCEKSRAAGMDCIFWTFPGVAHGLFDNGAREALIQAETARFLSCRVGVPVPLTDLARWVRLPAGWAERNGVVTGYADRTFRADRPVERGQLVAQLWRLAGPGDPATEHAFSDVPPWLEEAMDWAGGEGIVTGFSDGTVRPRDPVTRAQAARMLHRAAGSVDPSGLPGHGLTDVPAWVADAVTWLVAPRAVQLLDGGGMATGFADLTFRPGASVTRGQVVRWLHGLALAGDAWDPARQDAPVAGACHRLGDP